MTMQMGKFRWLEGWFLRRRVRLKGAGAALGQAEACLGRAFGAAWRPCGPPKSRPRPFNLIRRFGPRL